MTIRFPNEGDLACTVMLAWPHEQTDWQPWLELIHHCYTEFVSQLSRHARVLLLCRDQQHQQQIADSLARNNARMPAIEFFTVSYNDTWVRDYGPITILKNQQPLLLDFQFNAWGGKYQASDDNAVNSKLQSQGLFNTASDDNAVNSKLQSQGLFNTRLLVQDTILEGGSIDTDGQGTLITTSQCLVSETRNANMQKADWERLFHEQFGIERTLWLDHGGLIGDDTDSHVDMLARFCNPGTIAYTSCEDPADIHYAPLQEMQQQLASFRKSDGKPYELVALPLPKAIIDKGERLPASYANFLILNDAVFVPCYDDPADEVAMSRLQSCFPRHQLVGIKARPLIRQYGSLHCATMQLPLSVLTKTGDR